MIADMQVYQVTLQTMILNLTEASPMQGEFLASLKAQIEASLDNTYATGPEDPQDAARMKALTKMRFERFFLPMEEVVRQLAARRK